MALLWLATKSFAGVADLSLNIEHQPLYDLAFGQIIPYSVTVTNNGPDEAGADSMIKKSISASFIININTANLLPSQDQSIEQSCDFILTIGEPRPGNPVDFIYSFFFPNIPAGESLTCYGLLEVNFESGIRSIDWFIFSPNDIDPDQNNNNYRMTFGIRPPMVPTLSIGGLGMLLFLTLTLAFHRMRTQLKI